MLNTFLLTLVLYVVQQVDGVPYAAYLVDKASHDSVFIATIAAAVGTPTDSVKNLVVSDAASRRRTAATSRTTSTASGADAHLRVATRKGVSVLAVAVDIVYTVEMAASSGVTFEQMASSLSNSVESGRFTTLLRSNAVVKGTSTLATASSSSAQTHDTTPRNEGNGGRDTSTLSIGAIVSIVIGGFAALLGIAYLTFRMCNARSESIVTATNKGNDVVG